MRAISGQRGERIQRKGNKKFWYEGKIPTGGGREREVGSQTVSRVMVGDCEISGEEWLRRMVVTQAEFRWMARLLREAQ
jgi:hypothetical protein